MNKPESDAQTNSTRKRSSKVKKASTASVGVTLLLVVGYLIASWLGIPLDGLLSQSTSSQGPDPQRPAVVSVEGQTTVEPAAASDAIADAFKIEDVTIVNLDGKVVFQGTIDLTETMQRIDAGQRLRFRNDGSTFQNRERRLPVKERGYYKEYVHPTPKLGGPGPQRVVTGEEREAYYTSDHYKTFRRIR